MFVQTKTTSDGLALTNRSNGIRHRRAFTLIELMVVVMVIGILATFVMVALAGVNQSAKEDRTTALVARINELLMEKYDSYQYRRMPPANATLAIKRQQPGFEAWLQNNGGYGLIARDRLTATREMMRLELPCTIDEVRGPTESRQSQLIDHVQPKRLIPALSRAYYARASRTLNGDLNAWSPANESAECLYLILSQMRSGDSSAMEFFSENEVGDTDGDGMNEVLDGWGQPILWQRWAPGFISTLQVSLQENPEQEDMFDPMQVGAGYQLPDNRPRALFPLVFSAGPDGKYGINVMGATGQDGVSGFDAVGNSSDGWFGVSSDPYAAQYSTVGTVTDGNGKLASDNITNHLLSTR